jgi:hypothetical protein
MKRFLWACGLGLMLLARPGTAQAFVIGNYEVDSGARVWCNVRQFNICCPSAGPWYLYWPYEAYFNAPTPGVNPYFVRPMSLPAGFAPPGAPLMQPANGAPLMQPANGAPPPSTQAPMPPATNGYRPPMPTPGPAYQPPPPNQGYRPPMPTPVPSNLPPSQFPGANYTPQPMSFTAQGYQGQGYPGQAYPGQAYPGQAYPGYQGYQPPAPTGPPHPEVFNFYNK